MGNNGRLNSFCDRCGNEGGASPLRSRCQVCCTACFSTHATNTITSTSANTPIARPYTCGNVNSGDCQSEYTNALNNGRLNSFCDRCGNEGGASPLRSRCQVCCTACFSTHAATTGKERRLELANDMIVV